MPVLPNPKHESFAQARYRGETADQAYQTAGYDEHRGNAARMSANESIKSRIAELQAATAQKMVEDISFDAKVQFDRMQNLVTLAIEAGDFKTAANQLQFIAECFGYRDSPTLTHEHVAGKKLEKNDAGEPSERAQLTVGLDFTEATKAFRRALG